MKKPAYKTVSFWVTVALTNLGLVLVSGVATDSSVASAAGWLVAVAASLGYKGWAKTPELPPGT